MLQDSQEIWLPVQGYEGLYEVSNLARIRSLPRTYFTSNGKIVRLKGLLKKQTSMSNGYLHATFTKDGKTTQHLIHVLVAKAFVENPNGYPHVNHKDLNPKNCLPENLEWVTHQQNIIHARDNGKMNALTNPKRRFKLQPEQVSEMRMLAKKGERHGSIAEKYGVSRECVSQIARNERWKEVVNNVTL